MKPWISTRSLVARKMNNMSEDPYFYNHVNLSGKMDANTASVDSGGLLHSVSTAVGSGYSNARRVVFGESESTSSVSLFSLSYQQIVNFGICFAVGSLFMFMAFLFLPMVVLSPHKFTLLFTLGCLSWIVGLGMLQGTGALISGSLQKQRLPFTLGYLISLVGVFYSTLFAHSYILTVLFSVTEIACLFSFMITYFPGGSRVLAMVNDMFLDRVKGMVGGRVSTVLPI